jgi:protein SCO1
MALAMAASNGEELKAGVFSPARPAPDFSLHGSDGSQLSLGRYRGKVVLLGFGYTSCTEVCPVTLAILAQARRQLGVDASGLQVVYITVDPEKDDVARMHKFLANFDPTFIGGTGTAEQLAAVRRQYGITAVRKSLDGGDYAVAHSSFVYLIDRDGKLRALMPFGHSARDYAHDVRLLLGN